MEDVVGTLGKACQFELSDVGVKKADVGIDKLESEIEKKAGAKWSEVRKIAKDAEGKLHVKRRRAFVLIYAHLLRIEVSDPNLQKGVLLRFLVLVDFLNHFLAQSNLRFYSKFHSFLALSLTCPSHVTG